MSKAPEKTAAPAESKELVAAGIEQIPSFIADDAWEFAGAGVSTSQTDFLVPFLGIAQPSSPQLKKQQEDKFIKGLEQGDIFNSATGKFWSGKEGVDIIVAFFKKAEVEWILRTAGGGYVATHDIDSDIAKKTKTDPTDPRVRLLPNGHQLVETAYYFVAEAETGSMAVISMTSTNLQVSRKWQTLMKEIKIPTADGSGRTTAPCFSRKYNLHTVYRSNDQGDWFQFDITDLGWVSADDRDAYLSAREFYVEAAKNGVQLGKPPESEFAGETIDGKADAALGEEEPPI